MEKLQNREDRIWYAQKAIEHNWSRNILVMQIESRLIERSGAAVTNFSLTLPKPESDLARESLKDPYRFDFLGFGEEAQEREIEHALIKHVTDFLLELGAGFAFVGRQVLLDVGGEEFFIDLLFYHLKLRYYVVIELKAGKFKPEHLGQLSFYLTAVDAQIKHPQDSPTIGLLLCKSKKNCGRIRAARQGPTAGCGGIPTGGIFAARTAKQPAQHRANRTRTGGRSFRPFRRASMSTPVFHSLRHCPPNMK